MLILPRRYSVQRPAEGFVLNRGSLQAQGLVGWWPICLDYLDRVAGNNGSPGGDAALTMLDFGGAVTLGSTGYVGIPDSARLRPAAVSAFAWMRVTAENSRNTIICNGNPGVYGTNNYLLQLSGSNQSLLYFGRTNGIFLTSSSGAFAVNALASVGFTCDGSLLTFYSNGRAWGSGSDDAGTDNTSGIRLGYTLQGMPFAGQIAHVTIYNRVLTPSEVWHQYDPATRWDLYYVPGRIVTVDFGAAPAASKVPVFMHHYRQQRMN